MKLRHEVHVIEQKLVEEEYDEYDRAVETEHWWLTDKTGMCSYLRVATSKTPVKIERVVTRADRRGLGLAGRLIKGVIDAHPVPLVLSAQAHLESWYATFGFQRVGENYLEAGIPHCPMERSAILA